MAGSSYPPVLLSTNWDKQAGALGKPTGVGDALKLLSRLCAAIDERLLETSRLKTADHVQERVAEIDARAAKQARSASDQAKAVATLARKCETDLKKNPQGKAAAVAAAGVARAATDFADELVKVVQVTRAELVARLAKLEAEERKSEPDDGAAAGDSKFVRDRVVAALKAVKAAKPESKPTLFIVGVGKLQCMPYMGPSVGGSHKTLLAHLMEGDSGIQFYKGECLWEHNAYTFVGDNIPTGGFAKRLQKGLLELTKVRYPVRVRRTDGEAEEAEGDEETTSLDAATLQAAMNRLTPQIKDLIGDNPTRKDEILRPVAAFQAHLKSGQLEAAQQALAQLSTLLEGSPSASSQSTTTTTAATGKSKLEDAMAQWQARRSEALGQLRKLEDAIRGMHHPKGDSAVILLSAIQKNLSAKPSSRQNIDELESYLRDDDIISDAESPNGFGIHINIRQPLLQALSALRASIAN